MYTYPSLLFFLSNRKWPIKFLLNCFKKNLRMWASHIREHLFESVGLFFRRENKNSAKIGKTLVWRLKIFFNKCGIFILNILIKYVLVFIYYFHKNIIKLTYFNWDSDPRLSQWISNRRLSSDFCWIIYKSGKLS